MVIVGMIDLWFYSEVAEIIKKYVSPNISQLHAALSNLKHSVLEV